MSHRPDIKPILKQLEAICNKGYQMSQVFRDWVALMLFALIRDDDEYLKVMTGYRNKDPEGSREADYFARAMAELLRETEKGDQEVLGDLYMEIRSGWDGKGMGQYFTPWPICDMKARMVIADEDQGQIKTACDPCCGSGRNLLAAAKLLHPDSHFTAIDNDLTCASMTAINFTLFNMNAAVIYGNSIAMKFHSGWVTTHTPIGGAVRWMAGEELDGTRSLIKHRLKQEQPVGPGNEGDDPQPDPEQPQQLQLF